VSLALFAVDPASVDASLGGALVALVTLTLMEIVLGIDNVIFIAVLAGRLPHEQQDRARKLGLAVALGTRLVLLGLLFVLAHLDQTPVWYWSWFVPKSWVPSTAIDMVSIKDVVMLVGGGFLIAKSTLEIHHKLEGQEEAHGGSAASFRGVITQIALLDIVFSLDSVITAVGMAREIWVMIAAMVLASVVMVAFSGYISEFVARHPTVKILALAFLILIGVMLVAEGFNQHISKGYIYFAMAFSVTVEMLNLRLRARGEAVRLKGRGVSDPHPASPPGPASASSPPPGPRS
jgi:predicted tellurium resistance membrane protein TerC